MHDSQINAQYLQMWKNSSSEGELSHLFMLGFLEPKAG